MDHQLVLSQLAHTTAPDSNGVPGKLHIPLRLNPSTGPCPGDGCAVGGPTLRTGVRDNGNDWGGPKLATEASRDNNGRDDVRGRAIAEVVTAATLMVSTAMTMTTTTAAAAASITMMAAMTRTTTSATMTTRAATMAMAVAAATQRRQWA